MSSKNTKGKFRSAKYKTSYFYNQMVRYQEFHEFHKQLALKEHISTCSLYVSSFLAHFLYFEQIKVSLYDHHAACVYYHYQLWHARTSLYEAWYITAPQTISMIHFTNPSHQSVGPNVYIPNVARQRLSKSIKQRTHNYTQHQNCKM
jgi:hypothetical protein